MATKATQKRHEGKQDKDRKYDGMEKMLERNDKSHRYNMAKWQMEHKPYGANEKNDNLSV